MQFQDFFGIPTVHGYNAPCFENVVHYYVGSVLMRWDNEDRKDRSITIIPNCHDSYASLHFQANTEMRRQEYIIRTRMPIPSFGKDIIPQKYSNNHI